MGSTFTSLVLLPCACVFLTLAWAPPAHAQYRYLGPPGYPAYNALAYQNAYRAAQIQSAYRVAAYQNAMANAYARYPGAARGYGSGYIPPQLASTYLTNQSIVDWGLAQTAMRQQALAQMYWVPRLFYGQPSPYPSVGGGGDGSGGD
jgi:hypothetical protein